MHSSEIGLTDPDHVNGTKPFSKLGMAPLKAARIRPVAHPFLQQAAYEWKILQFLICPDPAAAQTCKNAPDDSFELSAHIKPSKVFTLGQLVWEAALG